MSISSHILSTYLKSIFRQNILTQNGNDGKANKFSRRKEKISIAAEHDGSSLILLVDKKEVLRTTSYLLSGTGQVRVAVRAGNPAMRIQNVEVFRLAPPENATALMAGDTLLEEQLYEKAIRRYLLVDDTHPGSRLAEIALQKAYMVAASKLNIEPLHSDVSLDIKKRIAAKYPDFNHVLLLGADETLRVCGIEIQEAAARQARENAEENGVSDRFCVVCGDLRQAHAEIAPGSFDCVLSNPPYYPPGSGYLHAQDSLCAARSEICCPFDALCAAAARALRWGGRFFLVHKPERLVDLMTGLRAARLEPKRIRFVRHRAGSSVNLVLIEARLGGGPGLQFEPDLVLYTQTGELSAAGRRIYHLQE